MQTNYVTDAVSNVDVMDDMIDEIQIGIICIILLRWCLFCLWMHLFPVILGTEWGRMF